MPGLGNNGGTFMLALTMCAISFVACVQTGGVTQPPVDMVMELDDTAYAPGDTIQVVLQRVTEGESLFATMCDLFVEAQCNEEWTTVFTPDCSKIRVRPTHLAVGESIVTPFILETLPDDCGPFRLRLRYQQADGGDGVVVSPEFEITTG
jgi:hypothetical protein